MKNQFENNSSNTKTLSVNRRAILSATNPIMAACGATLFAKGSVVEGSALLLGSLTSTCLLIRDLLRDRNLGQQASVSEEVTLE